MVRNVEIEWYFEKTSLEIKTDSELGSDEYVYVNFYNAAGDRAGGVYLSFSSTMRYRLPFCSSYANIPVTPPSSVNKVWRISLSKTSGIRLIIHCNGEEVLNTLLSGSVCTFWTRAVEKIKFLSSDGASDGYRAFKGSFRSKETERELGNQSDDRSTFVPISMPYKILLYSIIISLYSVLSWKLCKN